MNKPFKFSYFNMGQPWFKTWKQDAIWVFLCFSSPSMPIRTYGKTFINWSLRLKCKQLLIFLVDVVILKINCAFRPTTKGIHQSLIPNTMLVQPIELRWKIFVTPFYLVTHFVLDLWNLTIDFAHGSFVAQMSRKVLLTSYFFLAFKIGKQSKRCHDGRSIWGKA